MAFKSQKMFHGARIGRILCQWQNYVYQPDAGSGSPQLVTIEALDIEDSVTSPWTPTSYISDPGNIASGTINIHRVVAGTGVAETGYTISGGANLTVTPIGTGQSQSVAYATTITPNAEGPILTKVATITGNLTIANPTGTPFPGRTTLSFYLPVDATGGYTLAFGTTYKLVGGAAPALTANTTVQISFAYDGTNWRETARSIT